MSRKDWMLLIKVGAAGLAWADYSKQKTNPALIRALIATLALGLL